MKKLFEKISRLNSKDLPMVESIVDKFLTGNEDFENEDNYFDKINKKALIHQLLLGDHVTAIVVEAENGTLAVHPQDMVVGMLLREHGAYGIGEIQKIKSFLTNKSKVLIVGAHVGAIVVPIAKCCREVVAIEANPFTYKLLTSNIKINGINNCRTYNIAANDKKEQLRFYCSKVNSGGSKRKPAINDYAYVYDAPEEINVNAMELDELLENEVFDLITMDIEGSEYFALKGMAKLIKGAKVLFIEFIPHHLIKVANITVDDFLDPLKAFETMLIPSRNLEVEKEDFRTVLQFMMEEDITEDNLIFIRN